MMQLLRHATNSAQTITIRLFLPTTKMEKRTYAGLRSSLHTKNAPSRKLASLTSLRLASGMDKAIVGAPALVANFWNTMSQSTPVFYVQQALVYVHDTTGLPWWAAVFLSTLIFRSLVTLPLAIYQQRISARIELITLEMPAIVEQLKREAAIARKKFQWSEKETRLVYNRSLRKQWNKLVVRENCHPAKTLVVLWGQIPLWVCQSVALRNLAHMLPDPSSLQAQLIFTELTIGGFGWIPNLTEVDSSYILPVALGMLNLIIVEVQTMTRKGPTTRFRTIATNTFRALSIVTVPVACFVPSVLCVYWVTSSTYSLVQHLLLLSPTLRRSVGIQKTERELSNPYEHLWTTMKSRTLQGGGTN